MKRRDSLPFRFSNHGLKRLFAEEEGLLSDYEDDCGGSPPRDTIQIRPSCISEQDVDSSDSWFIEANSEPEDCDSQDELRNIQRILVHLNPESKEKPSPSRRLSGIFSRVARPKIYPSRSKCVVREQENKVFDDLVKVRLKSQFTPLCQGLYLFKFLIEEQA